MKRWPQLKKPTRREKSSSAAPMPPLCLSECWKNCPDIDVIVRQEYDFTLDEVMKAGAGSERCVGHYLAL